MEAYQERVITEKSELDEKIKKLNAFFDTRVFRELPQDERRRLMKQLYVMREYSFVLAERIEAFK